MRYRGSSKIKFEHSMVPGLLEFLETEFEPLEYIEAIIPGRISRTDKAGNGLRVNFKYPVKGGAKFLAYSSGAVQEVFVVTSRPDKLAAYREKAKTRPVKLREKPRKPSRPQLETMTTDFLRGLGEPAPSALVPSPFQEEALELVTQGDVIVTAPTGSGKTWIAERAIEKHLWHGKSCWYTTPLKALSNQKYENFQRLLGSDKVGLLTGERKEKPASPLIVATTEVFRNALYSGEEKPWLAVLDEAHYLGDEQRGTTWEEIIILAHSETRLLLLSATISNADEIADWMEEVRGSRPFIVREGVRPVPLRSGFLTQRRFILPLAGDNVDSWRKSAREFDPVRAVETLEQRDLLPAIIFLPSRRDCDHAATRFAEGSWKESVERLQIFAEAVKDNPYLWTNPLRGPLVEAGVASHHAGHLTGWKVAVERMLAGGKLRVVFATTTLAAGLDVPARTVLLPTLIARDGFGSRALTTLEYHQMTGRAGRRGKDKIGFVVLDPRNERDLMLALSFQDAEPEPIKSAFKVNYHQILNLLSRFDLNKTREILSKSLLLHQQSSRRELKSMKIMLSEELRKRIEILQRLRYLNKDLELTKFGLRSLVVRHENSLIATEVIRRKMYEPLSPAGLAGWAAALVSGRSPRRVIESVEIKPLLKLVAELERLERWKRISTFQFIPEEAGGKAAVVKQWVEGKAWEDLIRQADIQEGDLQWLLLQTAEVLHQLEDLPLPVADRAREARQKLLRTPIT